MSAKMTATSLSVTLAASKRAKPSGASTSTKKSENEIQTSFRTGASSTSAKTRKRKESFDDTSAFIIMQHDLRKRVLSAVSENRVFLCYGYPIVAEALVQRGWVQKNKGRRKASTSLEWVTLNDPSSQEATEAWIERTLQHIVPSFIWAFRSKINWRTIQSHQIVSVHPRAYFTTKDGLIQCLNRMHWYGHADHAFALTPRAYRLREVEERVVFVADYRLTACMGILKWIVGTYEEIGIESIMDENGTVGASIIEFAIHRVNRYIHERRHKDIDNLEYPYTKSHLWENVLKQFHELLFYKGKIKSISIPDALVLYDLAKKSLQKVAPFWNLNVDGTHNVWIFKPARRSNGVGLMVTNSLDEIFEMDKHVKAKYDQVIVQKYLERPLLIYNTKFDIRQWFLVSDWNPLTIWTYRESYIRFSTQPFTTENFNRSIHLCNNSVQRRFQVSKHRDSNLPDDNMWDSYTFQAYLNTIDQDGTWDAHIYPGMKRAILATMLSFQEDTVVRKNCFEIYGADFILDEELNPWLLEINSGPTMAHSTSVTERMCRQFQEDIIKVIIDRRENPMAETGMFELAYKHPRILRHIVHCPRVIVKGKRLKLTRRQAASMSPSKETLGVVSAYSMNDEECNVPTPSPPSKGIAFHDLVSRFHLKDIRETENQNLPTERPITAGALSLTLLEESSDDHDPDDDIDDGYLTDYETDDSDENDCNEHVESLQPPSSKSDGEMVISPGELMEAESLFAMRSAVSSRISVPSTAPPSTSTATRSLKNLGNFRQPRPKPSAPSSTIVKTARQTRMIKQNTPMFTNLLPQSSIGTYERMKPKKAHSAMRYVSDVKPVSNSGARNITKPIPAINRPTGKKRKKVYTMQDILLKLNHFPNDAQDRKQQLTPLFKEYMRFWNKLI